MRVLLAGATAVTTLVGLATPAGAAGAVPRAAAALLAATATPPTSIVLETDKTQLSTQDRATLTATLDRDTTNTGYGLTFVNQTTGNGLGNSGCHGDDRGYHCTVRVGWSASPTTYIAELVDDSGGVYLASNTVTITPMPFTISLTIDKTEVAVGQSATLTVCGPPFFGPFRLRV